MSGYESYKTYLEALFTPTDTVCFALIEKGQPIKHIFAPFEQAVQEDSYDRLLKRNETANVFVAMNPYKPELIGQNIGRTKENVAEVRRLYADADKDGDMVLDVIRNNDLVPPPTVVLNTSPGKFHIIWNVNGLTKETAEPLLKAIAQEFNTDPAVAEISRILRVPGFRNRKPGYTDAPEVKIIGDIDSSSYDPIDFRVKTKVVEAPKEIPTEKKLVQVGDIHGFMRTVAGKLRNDGLTQEEILPILRRRVNEECQRPPDGFDDTKIIAMARSMSRYKVGKGGDILFTDAATAIAGPAKVEPDQPIVTVSGDDFLVERIPPRKILLSTISGDEPVIFEQSINQVFAWRGAGKTCLGLGLVRALATGERFLNFKATGRTYVLYVEGELPDSQFQERWRSIVGKTDGYAHMASIDKQPGHHYVSMATDAGMQMIEATLTDLKSKGIEIKVLMLDNISTLFNVKANDEEVWIPIQSWLTSLRSRGITVFFFHHAGKGGLSRSHSKSEDMLDVSIKLEEPEEPEQGHLHSLMTFDKARAGLSEKPAEIKLHRTHSPKCQCEGKPIISFCPGDGVRWEHIPKASKRDEAYRLFAEGKSIPEVSIAVDSPDGTIRRWRTQWGKLTGNKL